MIGGKWAKSLAAVAAVTMLVLAPAQVRAGDKGLVSEIKAGVFWHDFARDAGKQAEENTVDLNGEILFGPFKLADTGSAIGDWLLTWRPHLGGSVNTAGKTSLGYAGITWEYQWTSGPFFEFAFGFAAHDGQLTGRRSAGGALIPGGRPNLGSPVLFREGLDLGYRFQGGHSVAAHISHISNAGWLAKENDGMNFMGLRYGYRF